MIIQTMITYQQEDLSYEKSCDLTTHLTSLKLLSNKYLKYRLILLTFAPLGAKTCAKHSSNSTFAANIYLLCTAAQTCCELSKHESNTKLGKKRG